MQMYSNATLFGYRVYLHMEYQATTFLATFKYKDVGTARMK